MTAGGWFSARDHEGDLELGCDVVVVGSGAGGAVIATELALAGQDVLVLEEGPRVTPEEFRNVRPSESLRHAWRDAAFSVALGIGDTPTVNVTMGRTVGGSSTLTGGVCFRTPEEVLQTWQRDRGLTGMTPAALEPCFEHVERAIHVETVPEAMRSKAARLFGEGAERMGFAMKPLRRNTRGCKGCGRCNFGCPEGAKLSVDLSYLPRAVAAGARVWSHCRVDKVTVEGDRARGVTGRILTRPGARPGGRLRVRARRVVICCGGWYSPVILDRSRVGRRSGQLGRNLTLHPSFRMIGRFDEPVHPWRGATQSTYSDAFMDEGITLTSLVVPPGVLAATMPGIGPEHVRRAADLEHLAMFGGLLHDDGGGVVRRAPGGGPLVTYRMSPRVRALLPRTIRMMAETFLAAGAREVFLPVLGLRPVDGDGLRRLDLDRIHGRRFEVTSQHPLGSCRMGADPSHSVVDPDSQAWEVRDLYVADGSVVPTSLGVNPQLSIMALATRIAWTLRERPLPTTA